MRFLLGLVAWLAMQGAFAQAPSKPMRVLFIGNATIATSDIPQRVGKVARAVGRDVKVDAIASGDYTLEDHWREGRAMQAVRDGWDFVVLQQDVPAPADDAQFVGNVKRFAAAIRDAGARPALFMTWPRADRIRDIRDAIATDRAAAEAADALLCPVAEAWLRALAADRRLKLYAGVGTQPSALGADLAVLTTYLALFPAQDFDEAFVDKVARALGTPAATRDLLFDVATRAIDEPLPLEKPPSR